MPDWFEKWFDRYIGQIIKNMNLRKKILLLYLFVVVIPVILIGLIAENIIFNFLRTDYSVSINEAVDQVVKNVEFRKLTYELLVTRTATDGELAARISREYDEFYAQWETVNYIDRSFGLVREFLPGIAAFRVYHNNTTLVEDGGILWKTDGRVLAGMNENGWYESILSADVPMRWELAKGTEDSAFDLILSRKISWNAGGEAVGAVCLQVRSGQIFNNIINNAFYGQGDVFLLNDENIIFSSTRQDYIGKKIDETPFMTLLKNGQNTDSVMEFEGHKDIFVSKPVSSGWRVVAAVPLKNLENKTRTLSTWVIGITLCLVILSAVLMLAVINNIVFRLRGLEHKMTSVTKGKFDVTVMKGYADELGDLEEKFNLMSGRLGELTDEIAYARSREREEALKALQAQINPHFLYNTLGIIRWRALDVGDAELCRLVDAMTIFYRLSLNKGNTVLKIHDELEHVKAYIEIQQFRYLNSVSIHWNIDPSIMELFTIKLILQPIVENCYMHGMVAKRKHGIINISAGQDDGEVFFEIGDNGIGASEDDMRQILNGNSKANTHGYGLINIQERLKLYFADKGRLSIQSKWGEGTVVTIRIPVCIEPPEFKGGNNNA